MTLPTPVPVIRSRLLDGVPHGFLGRQGGVSGGLYASLNVGLGSGDATQAVAENRRRAADAVLPGARLATVHQVHSATVVEAEPWADVDRPHADALVTNRPGLLLGVLSADCVPVLLADRQAGVIGAAHSGWKGALADIPGATVAAMERLGADRARVVAAIGPCIGRASYEVDDDFAARFTAANLAFERFFQAGRPGHALFDIEAFVAMRLADAGVGRIDAPGLDTYCDEVRFFSYRRATHRREPDYGRQVALIGLSG